MYNNIDEEDDGEYDDITFKKILLTWDDFGIESIIDLQAAENEDIMSILSDNNPSSIMAIINKILLRVRFNSHRNYEVYIISIPDTITIEFFRENFTNELMALVRKKGIKLW